MNYTKKGFEHLNKIWNFWKMFLLLAGLVILTAWASWEAINTPQEQMDKYMESPAAPITRWEFLILPILVIVFVAFMMSWFPAIASD